MFSRVRWKPLAVLATILIGGMVATCLLLHKAQERPTFFGEVDPMTGYRCWFTLPSGWKQETGDSYHPSFVEPALSPVQEWINSHLWHRPVTDPMKIYLDGESRVNPPLHDWYPEKTFYRRVRILTHRHLLVNGYNATLIAFDAPGDSPNYGEYLFVYVPASATVYKVLGVSKVSSADRLDREMQGVIASFHAEKAPVSATDLEVIETALSDWQSLNGLEHKKSGDDQVVVYNKCLEDFKPQNHKLVMSDMKAFREEIKGPLDAPDYEVWEDYDKVRWPLWKRFFPHAFAYIYVGRPTYPDNETAILELTSGPEPNGDSTNTYTLKRKQGKWSIIKREVLRPE